MAPVWPLSDVSSHEWVNVDFESLETATVAFFLGSLAGIPDVFFPSFLLFAPFSFFPIIRKQI